MTSQHTVLQYFTHAYIQCHAGSRHMILNTLTAHRQWDIKGY